MDAQDATEGQAGGSENSDADRANASSTYNATEACGEYVRDVCGRNINSRAGCGNARNWRTVTDDVGRDTEGSI